MPSRQPLPEIQQLENLTLKIQGQGHRQVKGQGHIVGPTLLQFISLWFLANQTPHS